MAGGALGPGLGCEAGPVSPGTGEPWAGCWQEVGWRQPAWWGGQARGEGEGVGTHLGAWLEREGRAVGQHRGTGGAGCCGCPWPGPWARGCPHQREAAKIPHAATKETACRN